MAIKYQPITRRELLLEVLVLGEQIPPEISADQVLEGIAQKAGIPLEQLFIASTDKRIQHLRHLACYRLREDYGWNYPEIAQKMGYKYVDMVRTAYLKIRGAYERRYERS